jgi:alpha-L-rhamnosidase
LLEYSERDNEDCTFKQRDVYVCSGRAGERFQNHFNYRAFRWVTVSGLDELLATNEITGRLVRTSYRVAGDFECSNPLLNQIYQACQWTYQCLSINGYTVDCPHREKLGYGGDAHATCETGLSQFDLGAFYTKWLMDWRDCQDPSGEMPHTAPQYMGGGGPGWGGICVVLPWELYLRQGDRGILETSYASIQKWLGFLESKSSENLLRPFPAFGLPSVERAEWSFLGDWVAPGRGQQPGQRVDDNTVLFFNNCYWLLNLDLAAQIADVLGHRNDAARYRARHAEVSRKVQGQFFNATNNSYANGEQPYLVFPLIVGVTPPELRPRVEEQLVHTILETDKGHINSGMHGCWLLFDYLMAHDRNDLIYTMVSQTNYPGWGYMISQGATTIWEEWNGNNSRLHSTLLAVGNWFSEGIAGLRPDPTQPGYKRFLVQPAPVGGLTWARARFDSPYGLIRSEWRVEHGVFKLDLQVPPNSAAVVSLPTQNAASVRENDQPAAKSPGLRFLRQEDNRAIFECAAGHYAFTADLP